MKRHQRYAPSPAIIVAVLALVAGLAGTAVAGQGGAVTKKKVKKIATKQIDKLAPGLSVANAETATNATNAANADDATHAKSADTAASATNADNAAKVAGSRVCSGVLSFQSTETRNVCVSGTLRVHVSCAINSTSTGVSVEVDSDSADASAWIYGSRGDDLSFPDVEAIAEPNTSVENIINVTDSDAGALSFRGGSASVSAGHADGSSINGEFSARANRTGTGQGKCEVSMGAIAH